MVKSHDDVRQQRVRRIPYPVRVVMHPKDGNERVEGKVRNLSIGGMFIKTILPLKPGIVFDVEIPMQPLNFRGSVKVAWTRLVDKGKERPYGMAVEWFNLAPAQKKLVYRQIENHVRGGGDLLVGTPHGEREGRPAAKTPGASKLAAPDRARLIVGLAIAAVVVFVLLILL
jgi:hypothetical protein